MMGMKVMTVQVLFDVAGTDIWQKIMAVLVVLMLVIYVVQHVMNELFCDGEDEVGDDVVGDDYDHDDDDDDLIVKNLKLTVKQALGVEVVYMGGVEWWVGVEGMCEGDMGDPKETGTLLQFWLGSLVGDPPPVHYANLV